MHDTPSTWRWVGVKPTIFTSHGGDRNASERVKTAALRQCKMSRALKSEDGVHQLAPLALHTVGACLLSLVVGGQVSVGVRHVGRESDVV